MDFNAALDEGSCDAANKQVKPALPQVNAACKYQYEYLVAVVATGKDSSLLLELQAYQMMSAQFLRASLASLALFAASALFLY